MSPTEKRSITLTRGAAYYLEAVMQTPAPYKKTIDIERASKMYGHLRRLNPAKHVVGDISYDFVRGTLRAKDESDVDWQHRSAGHNDAWIAWQDEELVLSLSNRQYDICRMGLEWALKHENRPKLLNKNDQHILALIKGFDMAGSDEDTVSEETAE